MIASMYGVADSQTTLDRMLSEMAKQLQ